MADEPGDRDDGGLLHLVADYLADANLASPLVSFSLSIRSYSVSTRLPRSPCRIASAHPCSVPLAAASVAAIADAGSFISERID